MLSQLSYLMRCDEVVHPECEVCVSMTTIPHPFLPVRLIILAIRWHMLTMYTLHPLMLCSVYRKMSS